MPVSKNPITQEEYKIPVNLDDSKAIEDFLLKNKDKKTVLASIKEGESKIVIGTHALFQKDVVFKNLGLSIIDEQHRFGVNQRQLLLKKSVVPVM